MSLHFEMFVLKTLDKKEIVACTNRRQGRIRCTNCNRQIGEVVVRVRSKKNGRLKPRLKFCSGPCYREYLKIRV